MKVLLIVGGLVGLYCYCLFHMTDAAIEQTSQLAHTYRQADTVAGLPARLSNLRFRRQVHA